MYFACYEKMILKSTVQSISFTCFKSK